MSAGKKRDVIVVETPTRSQDSFGADIETWPPNGGTAEDVFAEYQPAGTREFPAVLKRHAETMARFVIWYRLDIHAGTHRIRFDGKFWNIFEPIHDRKRHETTIEASEIS